MNVEQMTNEELANWMVPFTAIDDRSSGYIKSIIDEAARRLRTSIPKPVVEVRSDLVFINGICVEDCDGNVHYALESASMYRKALGLEGGEDE